MAAQWGAPPRCHGGSQDNGRTSNADRPGFVIEGQRSGEGKWKESLELYPACGLEEQHRGSKHGGASMGELVRELPRDGSPTVVEVGAYNGALVGEVVGN